MKALTITMLATLALAGAALADGRQTGQDHKLQTASRFSNANAGLSKPIAPAPKRCGFVGPRSLVICR